MKIVDTKRNCTHFDTLSNGQVCQVAWDDNSTAYVMKIEPIEDAEYHCTCNAIDLEDGTVLCVDSDRLVTPLDAELRIV